MSQAQRITRDDLERKLRGVQERITGTVESKRNTLVSAAVATAVVVIVIVFLLGKRSGKRKSTVVEIRRV